MIFDVSKICDLKMLLYTVSYMYLKKKVSGMGGFTLLAKKYWILKIDKISKLIIIIDLFKM